MEINYELRWSSAQLTRFVAVGGTLELRKAEVTQHNVTPVCRVCVCVNRKLEVAEGTESADTLRRPDSSVYFIFKMAGVQTTDTREECGNHDSEITSDVQHQHSGGGGRGGCRHRKRKIRRPHMCWQPNPAGARSPAVRLEGRSSTKQRCAVHYATAAAGKDRPSTSGRTVGVARSTATSVSRQHAP